MTTPTDDTTNLPGPWADLLAVRAAHTLHRGPTDTDHFFDADEFFHTTYPEGRATICGRFFITGDRCNPEDVERYAIRVAHDDGRITTYPDPVDGLRRYATVEDARDECIRLWDEARREASRHSVIDR